MDYSEAYYAIEEIERDLIRDDENKINGWELTEGILNNKWEKENYPFFITVVPFEGEESEGLGIFFTNKETDNETKINHFFGYSTGGTEGLKNSYVFTMKDLLKTL